MTHLNYLDDNLSGQLRLGITPITGISIFVRRHLYIEPCPNNQTFGIKLKVFVCQQGVLHKELQHTFRRCWNMTPFSMQHRNAISLLHKIICPGSSITNTPLAEHANEDRNVFKMLHLHTDRDNSMITMLTGELTPCSLVTPYGNVDRGQHWLR